MLLHGYLESLEIWDDFALELSKSYRVLLVDLPGHGESDCSSDCDTVEGLAGSVNAILEYLKLSQVAIVGHSMGGYLALAFAELFPKRPLVFAFSTQRPMPIALKRDRVEWRRSSRLLKAKRR